MISATDMISPQDDRRHAPGPESLPLWSESYWFPVYDPKTQTGVVTRIGILPNQGRATLWMFISHEGRIVHNATDLNCPLPQGDIDELRVGNVTYRCLEPLRKWRLTYDGGDYGMDLLWEAICPVYQYPPPPGTTVDQAARHIEQSGRVRGTVRVAGKDVSVDCFGHRDHSWGGERDWSKLATWTYISCEVDERLSFNAVQIWFGPETSFKVGFFWDGQDVMGLSDLGATIHTNEDRTVQRGASLWLVNEKGQRYEVRGEVIDVCPVRIGPTQVNDAITKFQVGDRVGYGIIEYGYQTDAAGKPVGVEPALGLG